MSKKIKLTKGYVTIVDDDNYSQLSQYSWCVSTWADKTYAIRRNPENGKLIRMHRQIMKATKGIEIDHINGNTLDNRKQNLRLCKHKQNLANQQLSRANSSGYKGVSWNKQHKKWEAYIKVNQKRIHLGIFTDIKDAANAYNKSAKEHFGTFANLNIL